MKTEFDAFILNNNMVLVDFYAEWCEPCKLVLPVLEEVIKHFEGKLKLFKIDIDNSQELAKDFTVLSVPTLMLFIDGREAWRMRGFEVARDLIKTISSHIK